MRPASRVEKRFYFQPDGKRYVVNVEATIDVNGAAKPVTIHGGPGIGLGYAQMDRHPPGARRADAGRQSGTADAPDIQAQPRYEGEFRFAGVEDQFFVTAAVPAGEQARVEYRPIDLPVPGNTAGLTRDLHRLRGDDRRRRAPSRAVTMPFFIGPKDIDVLQRRRSAARERDRLRHVRVAGPAAASRAQVDQQLRRTTTAGRSSS